MGYTERLWAKGIKTGPIFTHLRPQSLQRWSRGYSRHPPCPLPQPKREAKTRNGLSVAAINIIGRLHTLDAGFFEPALEVGLAEALEVGLAEAFDEGLPAAFDAGLPAAFAYKYKK
jgi:hypothetical protein